MKKKVFLLLKRFVLAKRIVFPGKKPTVPNHILAIRCDRLGDVALSLEAIYSLIEHFPKAKVTLLVKPPYVPLLQMIPGVVECLAYDPSMSRKDKLALWMMLKRKRFDLSIDLSYGDTLMMALMMLLLRIPWRIGFDVGIHGFLYHEAYDVDPTQMYEKDVPKFLIKKSLEVKSLNYVLWSLSDQEKRAMDDWLEDNYGIAKDDFVIGLHTSCSALRPFRAWDIEKYIQLMSRIAQEYDCRIVLTGTKEESVFWEKVEHKAPDQVVSLMGQTDLKQLVYLLKRCDAFVSNNTGTMHLAVMLATPTVLVNGPSNLVRWGPRESIHRVVDKNLPCSGADCLAEMCQNKFACIKDITIEEVFVAFQDMVSRQLTKKIH